MINMKSQKGITMVSLVITIIILLILSGTAIYNMNLSNGAARYNNMVADITLLEDKILVYYNKYGETPKLENGITRDSYYEIDLSKLENITLNYGTKYNGDNNDVYLVNDNLEVYYLKGVEKAGEIYHEK